MRTFFMGEGEHSNHVHIILRRKVTSSEDYIALFSVETMLYIQVTSHDGIQSPLLFNQCLCILWENAIRNC